MRNIRDNGQGEGNIWALLLVAILLGLVLLTATRANAQAAASNKLATTIARPATEEKKFKNMNEILVQTFSSLNEEHNGAMSGRYKLATYFGYVPWSMNLVGEFAYNREYTYQRADGTDGYWENPVLAVTKVFASGKDFDTKIIDRMVLSAAGSMPANRDARQKTFLGSTGAAVRVTKTLGPVFVLQRLGYTRGYYEYELMDSGTVNSPDTFKYTSELTLKFSKYFAITGGFVYLHAISYQGVAKGSQWSGYSLDAMPLENLRVSLGVETDRPTMLPDGSGDQLMVFDKRASRVFLEMFLTI